MMLVDWGPRIESLTNLGVRDINGEMWPQAQVEGVRGELEYPAPFVHYCRYKVIRSSVSKDGWIERCRCGRQVVITLQRSESPEKTSAKVMKHWFDKDGILERMTGNGITSNAL